MISRITSADIKQRSLGETMFPAIKTVIEDVRQTSAILSIVNTTTYQATIKHHMA